MKVVFSAVLCVSLIAASTLADEDVLIADFEADSYADWTAEGDAFGSRPVRGALPDQQEVLGYRGQGLVNTFRNRDAALGTLTSPAFEISRDYVAFLIGGGNHPGLEGIELLVGDRSVRSATGSNSDLLSWHTWDVRELRGQPARLRIVDRSQGPFGYTEVDHILLTDTPRRGAGTWRIEDYRKSPDYYRERYRPQLHFTPELNWMNDPNGLVFYEGEYHLFYQHNPHGNQWGHMSWGHAVSRDLVHWQHLPIALHEEYGVMIFSGCAVVDWKNTSGFGQDGKPPLVAVYTGHGHGEQTQDLAFSNDRGRTWTKYPGNPVLDIGEAEFRDPKVFWHEPTRRWVMVVSLAAERRIRFYASADLKHWDHLSDFGPAGAKDKPNWECPDLFELPIEGEADQTRWVLQVDMGGGSVAGGSGGEYFVGRFDGEHFVCDDPPEKVRWVDYGRDFYAPVSWSDVPRSDGRRIWIGWMNNWETSLLPTHPWRGAMSLPRTLLLRRSGDGLRLVQAPVVELAALRGRSCRLENLSIAAEPLDLSERGVAGNTLELIAEFELGTAKEFGLRVRKGGREQTVIGYETASQQLFVDRTRSGEVDFAEPFAGRHGGPLPAQDGRIRIRVFVDTSSVEVFGNDGHTVITDRIFPDPSSNGVELYSIGGTTRLISLDAWPLESTWRQ